MFCLRGRLRGTIDTSSFPRAVHYEKLILLSHLFCWVAGTIHEITRNNTKVVLLFVRFRVISWIKSLAPVGASCYKDAPKGAFTMNTQVVATKTSLLRGRCDSDPVSKTFSLFAIPLLLFLSVSAFAQTSTADERSKADVRAVLDAQAAAWNRGDVAGYMDGYDRSPNTEFVGGDSITRGWQEVFDRYKKRYDTREKMGVLTFSDLEITVLSKDAALVLGRWHLKRTSDEPHGTFTLLFRKTSAGWRIVHDHTSSA
jgi:ketosteroid isomerase-like protein